METVWAFLADESNRETLGWIGGVVATVVSALWIAIKHFSGKKSQGNPAPNAGIPPAAAEQGLVSSGDLLVEGGVYIKSHSGPSKWAYALGAFGLIVLACAAVFSQGDGCVVNAAEVGGYVSGSQITVIGGSGGVQCD